MQNNNLLKSIDWITIIIYLCLVFLGWISIYAAVYNEDHANIFDMTQRYGYQVMWIVICLFVAASVLLIDAKYYYLLSSPAYLIMILVLIATLFFGAEVKGAKSWFAIGSFQIQPAEFGKLTTSLLLARYMSNYSFDINKLKSFLGVVLILGLPFGIVLLQNDTGSALVYGSFLFMLYREGLNKWIYNMLLMSIALFLFSFLIEQGTLFILITAILLVCEGVMNGQWRNKIVFAGMLTMIIVLVSTTNTLLDLDIEQGGIVLIALVLCLPMIIIYAYKQHLYNIFGLLGFLLFSIIFCLCVEYIFDNIMQLHQQKRILDLLGLEADLKHWGYNVNQSKIAIGSGGLFGKGFLQGTQTKYDFVPEQSTDFIFCTISEEMGFIGSLVVVVLFSILIFRLMRMGDQQHEIFGRVYCYCVASIFFFHVMVNLGMTIGLMPVIGIPLPFFSYGGSSLISFTLLLFIAIRMNMSNKERTLL